MLSDFGDFDLVGETASRNREERIRAAFERSKDSYAKERVITEPGWYDPPQIPPPTKLHVRNIDFSLNNLYMKRDYAQALSLALSQLEVEEANMKGDGREIQLVDFAIRCAIKLAKNELAGKLADKTAQKWSINAGLALISAEAYLVSFRPRDALSAILAAISLRGNVTFYISLVYLSLEALSSELGNSDALGYILSAIRPHAQPRSNESMPSVLDETSAWTWTSACGIIGEDQERLISLLCYKPSVEKEVDHAERSVKTL